jgi:hypothetical protein
MDEFIEHDGIDVATAKLLWELSVETADDYALQALLNKAKDLRISLKALIQLLRSNEGQRFIRRVIKWQKQMAE